MFGSAKNTVWDIEIIQDDLNIVDHHIDLLNAITFSLFNKIFNLFIFLGSIYLNDRSSNFIFDFTDT